MITCRQCRSAVEFRHYHKDNPIKEQQQVYCSLHDTTEPVCGYVGKAQNRLVLLEAPRCFKR